MSKSRMKRLSIQRAARKVEHTPGPWRYDADDKLNFERAFGIVRELGKKFSEQADVPAATEVIAEVCVDDGSGIAEADARLIAAAPCMLAALEAAEIEIENLLAVMVRIGRNVFRLPLPADVSTQRALIAVRAALAKARGQ